MDSLGRALSQSCSQRGKGHKVTVEKKAAPWAPCDLCVACGVPEASMSQNLKVLIFSRGQVTRFKQCQACAIPEDHAS